MGHCLHFRASYMVKWSRPPWSMRESWVWSLGQEDSLEVEMEIHYSILACESLWTEEPGGLQAMGLQRVDTTCQLSRHANASPFQCDCPKLNGLSSSESREHCLVGYEVGRAWSSHTDHEGLSPPLWPTGTCAFHPLTWLLRWLKPAVPPQEPPRLGLGNCGSASLLTGLILLRIHWSFASGQHEAVSTLKWL